MLERLQGVVEASEWDAMVQESASQPENNQEFQIQFLTQNGKLS